MACPDTTPTIRKWAHEATGEVRKQAIVALSRLGAPEDREWLATLTTSPDAKTRHLGAYALYEHGDPGSAPALRRLLTDPDADVRVEAIAGTFHLIDAEGAKALLARRRAPNATKAEVEKIDEMLGTIAGDSGEDVAALKAGAPRAWTAALTKYWKQRDAYFALKPGDRALNPGELQRVLDHWEKQGRFATEESDWTAWIDMRHVLSAATPADLPRLVAVRGSMLHRHSDEGLEEVGIVDRAIQVLRRRQAGAVKPNE
jgi:hypothetical protein